MVVMIATLNGVVAEKLAEIVVLDVGGVGYGLFVAREDYGKMQIGDQAKIYTYEHIRENQHDLYGFTTIDTKQLFEQLLGVNGVGPKMALSILSIGTANDVRGAIAEGNVKFLQSAAGVGRRVAERLVVDLKDKVGQPASQSGIDALLTNSAGQHDEAVQALVALGYTIQDAVKSLSGIAADLAVEERVKQALRGPA